MKQLIRQVTNLVRRHRLDYGQFRVLTREVRRQLNLRQPKRSRSLPHVLPDDALRRFFDAIVGTGNLQHEIMLKLLFYTAIRVSELCRLRVEDVDLQANKIYVEEGKGSKDRYVLYPEAFRTILKLHLAAHPENKYLFETVRRSKFSTRRVQELVQQYARIAQLPFHVHPHLLRHQALTWLTRQGLPDAAIQLISGHKSKKSLEVYQHMALTQVETLYQEAMRKVEL